MNKMNLMELARYVEVIEDDQNERWNIQDMVQDPDHHEWLKSEDAADYEWYVDDGLTLVDDRQDIYRRLS